MLPVTFALTPGRNAHFSPTAGGRSMGISPWVLILKRHSLPMSPRGSRMPSTLSAGIGEFSLDV